MERLTDNQKKIDLVGRLIAEGAIDFNEAIDLLKVEVEKEYIPYQTTPYRPMHTKPWWEVYPYDYNWTLQPANLQPGTSSNIKLGGPSYTYLNNQPINTQVYSV